MSDDWTLTQTPEGVIVDVIADPDHAPPGPPIGGAPDIFGPAVSGWDVEQAVQATLKKWFPTYLRMVERRTGRPPGALPLPRSWNLRAQFMRWPEDQLPAVIIVVGGLADEPRRAGSGDYWTRWSVGIAVVVSAKTPTAADRLKHSYALAARLCLLQQASLDGFAQGVDWIDETYQEVPVDVQRTGQAAIVQFVVIVAEAANDLAGPSEVPADPYEVPEPWPVVTEVEIEVDKEAIE